MAADSIEQLAARFEPTKPTATFLYDVDYRLLSVRLARLARATIEWTEGRWPNQATGVVLPAHRLLFRFDTPDGSESSRRARLSIHRSILIILSGDDPETLLYVKRTDERFDPLFLAPRQIRYFELYDFQSGAPQYYRRDYVTGDLCTQFPGPADSAQQGREVITTLKALAAAHQGPRSASSPGLVPRISVSIGGVATPFALAVSREDITLDGLGGAVSAVRADIRPVDEGRGRAKPVVLWCAPFPLIALRLHLGELETALGDAPDWGMVPLIADYALAVGRVRAQWRETSVSGSGLSTP